MTPRGRTTVARRARPSGDEGQITILAIGFTVLAILLVLVVSAAARVHLERTRLVALADLVALDASDAVDSRAYFRGDGRADGVPLTDADVRASVERYLRDHADATRGLSHVVVLAADSPDGRSAHVRLSAVAHPGGAGRVLEAWGGGVRLEADSTARAS